MKTIRYCLFIFLGLISQWSLANTSVDPLPSWNDSTSKTRIIEFVTQAVDEHSPHFLPLSQRIATFDNDGTLWSEMPLYTQFYFAIDQVKAKASQHPEWKTQEPFASAIKSDMAGIQQSGMAGLLQLVMATHTGMSVEQFDQSVKQWIKTARHPVTQRAYTQMVYQPMLELLHYLQANQFKIYIVSGGSVEFMRAWAPEVYGIPKEQILGTTFKTQYQIVDGQPVIMRLPEVAVNNDEEQKPLTIQNYIGQKPAIAVGNSDGDLQMLQWTKSASQPTLAILIHHTDAKREWAYDKDSAVGRLDKAMTLALKDQWNIVDMKKDWKVIYPQ